MKNQGYDNIYFVDDSPKNVDAVIKDSGIKDVFVVALGDNNPETKADWIEREMKNQGYDNIYFVDDSPKNVDAVRKRLNKYPNIRKKVQLVKHG